MTANHRSPLVDGWDLWDDVVLRSAGFPASNVLALSDPILAAAADRAAVDDSDEVRGALRDAFRMAEATLTVAIRRIASDSAFREAVAWQNPRIVSECLDKLVRGEPRNVKGRNHESTVANYLQRYSLKNDTIGFFGPVSWARWSSSSQRVEITTGETDLARRTLYHETWAIDAIAESFGSKAAAHPWLVPRSNPAHSKVGARIRRSGADALYLTDEQAAIVGLVNGRLTIREIAAELEWSEFPDLGDASVVHKHLSELVDSGVVTLSWAGPIEAHPEVTLLSKVCSISDPEVRRLLQEPLERYLKTADEIRASAGNAESLLKALDELKRRFTEITGHSGERRQGETYAGRTLVYEDTVGATRAVLGTSVREVLAPSLGLLLHSARWLVDEIAQEYDDVFLDIFRRRCGQSGRSRVPLASFMSLATPHLYFSLSELPRPVKRAVAKFQERWTRILGVQDHGVDIAVTSREIEKAVREEFVTASSGVPWATARHHAPDLMIAAGDVEALNRGEFLAVLGELHLSFNSIESRVFVEQHDNPGSLLEAARTDLGSDRIYAVPSKAWPAVSSRLAPPSALLSPDFTYWSLHDGAVTVEGLNYPAADLEVCVGDNDRLAVVNGDGSFQAPLLEVLGEFLSAAAVNAFKMLPDGERRPRVRIDDLVVARRGWRFTASGIDWAVKKSEQRRYVEARAWRIGAGLPERAFFVVPVDDKPVYIDFTSIAYVNILAKAIKKTAEIGGDVTLTEMLPDQSGLWLKDSSGQARTCELRMLAVDVRGRQDS